MNKTILLLILLINFIPLGCEQRKETVDAQSKVAAFLIDTNPELYKTMSKINEEIALADNKIIQLRDLKGMFASQRKMINKSLKQWQVLRKNLKFTLHNIYDKVEGAYVAYRIDEIQGRKKFTAISQQLLKEANAVLANAEVTKTTIERELYE